MLDNGRPIDKNKISSVEDTFFEDDSRCKIRVPKHERRTLRPYPYRAIEELDMDR
jgi:hypothetical protein